MSGSDDSHGNARPISVAELLAKNGTIGAPPVGGRRRRRRGNADAVTVAELTGEIPVIRTEEPVPAPVTESVPAQSEDADTDAVPAAEIETAGPDAGTQAEEAAEEAAEEEPDEEAAEEAAEEGVEEDLDADTEEEPDEEAAEEAVEGDLDVDTAEEDLDEDTAEDTAEEDTIEQYAVVEEVAPKRRRFGFGRFSGKRASGPTSSAVVPAAPVADAENMSPDPLDDDGQTDALDVPLLAAPDLEELDDAAGPEAEDDAAGPEAEDGEAEPEDQVELPSYLRSTQGVLFGGQTIADDLARRGSPMSEDIDLGEAEIEDLEDSLTGEPGRMSRFAHALWIVGQSVFAVLLGAGLFVAFDQLWKWNNIIALVLSVLVILGLVVAVRVVRKTEDIGSTLIAVVVGALITLGPLALLQSG